MTIMTLKGTSVALGIGLALLWIAGLASSFAPGWLTWCIGAAALAAFTLAGTLTSGDSRERKMGLILALSAALYGMGIAGLIVGGPAWLSWWTIGFASAFLILGIAAGNVSAARDMIPGAHPEIPPGRPEDDIEDRELHERRRRMRDEDFKKTG